MRQQVIKPYIEPNEAERARGEKQPTAAHHAIAELMAQGVVRLVLTTNFDQLLEQALADVGVHPQVVASSDHLAGAVPLIHAGPVIVKLHGDYLDTRIRNTQGELSAYEPKIDQLLDRVLDEFGLVVCGWSADWDIALKAAIDRAPSRRYPTYWAARGAPGTAATALIARRAARLLQVSDADTFFDALLHRVQAIKALRQPHPLSTDIALALLKEYLPEPRHAIRLHDLLNGELTRLLERLDSPDFALTPFSHAIFASQVERYRAATEPFLPLAYTAGLWATDEQARHWRNIVAMLAQRRRNLSGATWLLDLRLLPAALVMHAYCLGAIVGRRYAHVGLMLSDRTEIDSVGTKKALGDRLNMVALIDAGVGNPFKNIAAYGDRELPGSDLMVDVLRPIARNELRSDEAFEAQFAALELAISFGYAEREGGADATYAVAPRGRFLLHSEARNSWVGRWEEQDRLPWNSGPSELREIAGLRTEPQFQRLRAFFAQRGHSF